MNHSVLHKASGLLVVAFLALSITGKATSLYHEIAYRIQADAFIVAVLLGAVALQGAGAVGIFQWINQWFKRAARPLARSILWEA